MDVGWRWRERVAASGFGTSSRESSSARSFALPGALGRPTREPSRRSPSARAICSPRRRRGARCGSGTSAGASCFDRRCACLHPCSRWRSARTARSWRFRSVLTPTPSPVPRKRPVRRRPERSRDPRRRKRRAGCEAFPRRRGQLGCLLTGRQPARGWQGRRRRAPLGDRRLAAGGTSARSPERVHSRSGVLPGRAHTCDHALGPVGGALGRRLAGSRSGPSCPNPRRTPRRAER